MNLLDNLERKFGKFAIKGLMTYIVSLNLAVYLLSELRQDINVIGKLDLNFDQILSGEVWRVITFVFIPPAASVFWILFILYFYYFVGTALEQAWGSFRLNIYYFVGILSAIFAALLTGTAASGLFINLSLFLAFAYIYPNYEILLFFVLPVKVKYIAWFQWAFITYSVIFIPPFRIVALASVFNYFIFFGKEIVLSIKYKKTRFTKNNNRYSKPKDITYHKCHICGITEKDDSKMVFRYCSSCEGDYEYCSVHLKNHEHICNITKGN